MQKYSKCQMSTTLQINCYDRRSRSGAQNGKAELDYGDHKITLSLDLQLPKPGEAGRAGSEQTIFYR